MAMEMWWPGMTEEQVAEVRRELRHQASVELRRDLHRIAFEQMKHNCMRRQKEDNQ